MISASEQIKQHQQQHAEFLKRYEKASELSWKEIAVTIGSVATTAVLTITGLYFLG
ncbi:hypothetical protein IQ22_04359 [Pseudomonas duriflava]|uniref:Uncharacterized protein n=1 Tax=Pseudomonas duriflava TaxID=459528 RepID=A0A562PRM6_9PSED|nr:hypothetical protein [Pseudomonas duriflava]TWI47087.1 hypothetical protein IQ22_04359 [Pseudomonas duriflava]